MGGIRGVMGPKRIRLVLVAFAALMLVALLPGCGVAGSTEAEPASGSGAPVELRISAATSLKKVFQVLAPRFEKETGARVVLNLAASGVLHKQIEAGSPTDVFASASPEQVDALVEGGFVSAGEAVTFAANDLAIIVRADGAKGIAGPADLAKAEKLATGNPATAPHGSKAREWLAGLGTWESLEPRFVFAENAAQTVDYVARGEVDAGVVFASEAKGRDDVKVVYTTTEAEIGSAEYVIAPIEGTRQAELAKAWIEYVTSETGRKALTEAGFELP